MASISRQCYRCQRLTLHPSGYCHDHRRAENPNSMEFLTRPGNAHLLQMKLATLVTDDLDGEDEWEREHPRSQQVTLPGMEQETTKPKRAVKQPALHPDDMPRWAIYRQRRVRIISAPSANLFEILVDDQRTSVDRAFLRFTG